MHLRSLPLLGKVAGVLLIAAAVAGAGWGGRELLRPRPPAKTKALAPTTHPPIAALRDRMLQHYHGEATHVFTEIPGFGMERMRPLYQKIPFEVPYFSPAELEVAEGALKSPGPLMDVFAKSLTSFQDPAQPAVKPNTARKGGDIFPVVRTNGFGSVYRGTVAHGLQLRMLDLVGLTDPQSPKAYSGGKAFEMVRVNVKDLKQAHGQGGETSVRGKVKSPSPPAPGAAMETRALDFFEMAGVEELRQGKNVYIRNKDKVIRMLGALRAGEECLKCHTDSSKGDLLGAFSYTFVDVNRALTKEDKKKDTPR